MRDTDKLPKIRLMTNHVYAVIMLTLGILGNPWVPAKNPWASLRHPKPVLGNPRAGPKSENPTQPAFWRGLITSNWECDRCC
jgi:hypothetical protein